MQAKELYDTKLCPQLGKCLKFTFHGRNSDNDQNMAILDVKPLFRLLRQFVRPILNAELVGRDVRV